MRRMLSFVWRLLFPRTHEPRAMLLKDPDAEPDVIRGFCEQCSTAEFVCVERRRRNRTRCCAECFHPVVIPAAPPPPAIPVRRAPGTDACEECGMSMSGCRGRYRIVLGQRERLPCCADCYHRPVPTGIPGPGEKMSR